MEKYEFLFSVEFYKGELTFPKSQFANYEIIIIEISEQSDRKNSTKIT